MNMHNYQNHNRSFHNHNRSRYLPRNIPLDKKDNAVNNQVLHTGSQTYTVVGSSKITVDYAMSNVYKE